MVDGSSSVNARASPAVKRGAASRMLNCVSTYASPAGADTRCADAAPESEQPSQPPDLASAVPDAVTLLRSIQAGALPPVAAPRDVLRRIVHAPAAVESRLSSARSSTPS